MTFGGSRVFATCDAFMRTRWTASNEGNAKAVAWESATCRRRGEAGAVRAQAHQSVG